VRKGMAVEGTVFHCVKRDHASRRRKPQGLSVGLAAISWLSRPVVSLAIGSAGQLWQDSLSTEKMSGQLHQTYRPSDGESLAALIVHVHAPGRRFLLRFLPGWSNAKCLGSTANFRVHFL